ncbi:unnamed protein product (macronuclear) [Paramecium tetraurelia]|uniref:Uncharacterized protein n=1 Tax=Paramecium tetraurelia TaxID=5888 RepID=A0EBZ5_PARTE|nr:uncharacterized protein GSPATT00025548001 [Paramecium tetraurelia]CAK92812.1 unnamed protein product [Paramecium tetraurelia]|eukprot:XP_001460209.1 hypothetical protein (macronuclear) [Paramecium tetraurelia strain d4-2]
MKSNSQQCKKALISKREQNYIIDDELADDSTIFEQTTQSFSEISEFDSKQQFQIKHWYIWLIIENKNRRITKCKRVKFSMKIQHNTFNNINQNILNLMQNQSLSYQITYLLQIQLKMAYQYKDQMANLIIMAYMMWQQDINQIKEGSTLESPSQQRLKDTIRHIETSKKGGDIEPTKAESKNRNNRRKKFKKEFSLMRTFKKISKIYLRQFHCILNSFFRYTPEQIKVEPHLKPFIPEYIPSVLGPDAMLKIPRPDGMKDNLGLTVLDERLVKGIYMQGN